MWTWEVIYHTARLDILLKYLNNNVILRNFLVLHYTYSIPYANFIGRHIFGYQKQYNLGGTFTYLNINVLCVVILLFSSLWRRIIILLLRTSNLLPLSSKPFRAYLKMCFFAFVDDLLVISECIYCNTIEHLLRFTISILFFYFENNLHHLCLCLIQDYWL